MWKAAAFMRLQQRQTFLEYSMIFMKLMTPMMVMMVVVAAVVFIIVMYLMMKMMIDHSAFGISLMKIFGFNDGEVRKLYLDGNFITVAISALLGVPLAKVAMDALYPMDDFKHSFWPRHEAAALAIRRYLCTGVCVLFSH